jgi:putative DNA primase/helicase
LVFEAGAKLGTGLVQRRPAPWFREGAALDTTLVQDLTEDQQLEVARLKAQCRDSAAPEVARVRAVYEAQEREKLVAKGKTAEQAEEIVSERLSMTLNDEDELYFDHLKGMGITVGEARAQRAEFIDRTMADPLEPDYTGAAGSVIGGKAKLLARPTGELFIKSFAHGGCTYRLLGEVVDDFDTVQDELAATMVDRTDSGNVALLADLTQGNLRYVPETKTWLFWSGQRWEPDRYGVKAQFAALQVGQHYLDQAAELLGQMPPGLEARERRHIEQAAGLVKKWAEACRNKRGLDAMLGLAKVDYRFALPVNVLDRDPWLFGVDNGVVDLRTGALREASRDEYVTRRSPFAFNPNAPATRWLKFIDEITATPEPGGMHRVRPKLASYLQQALGYCMTGSTREHKMFIAIGEGSNGKSVLLDLLKEIMGEYGESISPEALMVSKHDADAERATPIARKLAGARTATSSESKDGQRLDVALVKRHTGGGFLTARGLHENSFTFEITHKLWLMTNHKPALDHMDEAMRGRLHMIPFDMKWNRPGHPERNPNFPDGDKTLIDQLRTEAEGALAWLVAGAVAYQRDGLEPPVEVSGMTKTYFADQDPFGLWFATCEQCDPKDGLRATDLLEAYRSWCDEEDFGDHAAGTSKAFSNKLKARGVVSVKTKEGRRYGLRPNDAEMSEVAP